MAFEVKAEMVENRVGNTGNRVSSGPRDGDRIAIMAMDVGATIGLAPACAIRDQQRDSTVELTEAVVAKSVATTKFYHRINSATNASSQKGIRKYSIKTAMYPANEAYEASDHEQVIAMLRSAGFVAHTDAELLEKLIPVAIVKRVS